MAGSTDPCIHAHLASIGKVGPELNGGYASVLTAHLMDEPPTLPGGDPLVQGLDRIIRRTVRR